MSLRPIDLLRDAAAAGAVLSGVAALGGPFGAAFAVGCAASVLNLAALMAAVGRGGAVTWLRLGVQLPVSAVLVVGLARLVDPLGLVLGFAAILFAMSARAVFGRRTQELA